MTPPSEENKKNESWIIYSWKSMIKMIHPNIPLCIPNYFIKNVYLSCWYLLTLIKAFSKLLVHSRKSINFLSIQSEPKIWDGLFLLTNVCFYFVNKKGRYRQTFFRTLILQKITTKFHLPLSLWRDGMISPAYVSLLLFLFIRSVVDWLWVNPKLPN